MVFIWFWPASGISSDLSFGLADYCLVNRPTGPFHLFLASTFFYLLFCFLFLFLLFISSFYFFFLFLLFISSFYFFFSVLLFLFLLFASSFFVSSFCFFFLLSVCFLALFKSSLCISYCVFAFLFALFLSPMAEKPRYSAPNLGSNVGLLRNRRSIELPPWDKRQRHHLHRLALSSDFDLKCFR